MWIEEFSFLLWLLGYCYYFFYYYYCLLYYYYYYTGHENKSEHHLTFLNLYKFSIQIGRYYIIGIFDITY